jgi:hypothetical protein
LRTDFEAGHGGHALDEIRATIADTGCIPVVVRVDKRHAAFSHNRYLQTEQGWWDLGRGFDWLTPSGIVRAVEIHAIDDEDALDYSRAFGKSAPQNPSSGW